NQRSRRALSSSAGILNAPQTHFVRARVVLTWISSTRPRSSATTASNNSGFSTGKERKENDRAGRKVKPFFGNHTVSGRPTSTSSPGDINGSAVNTASHNPVGLDWIA